MPPTLEPVMRFWIYALIVMLFMLMINKSMFDNTMLSRDSRSCVVTHQPTGFAERARYTPDAKMYMLIGSGLVNPMKMLPPYRYRLLTPMLVGGISPYIMGVDETHFMVNMAALYLFYLISGLTVFYLGANLVQAVLALLGTVSFWHLYNFANPYTVEPMFYLLTGIAIYALVRGWFWLFITALIVGMVNKETILFIAPAWFITKQYGKATIATLTGVLMYALPRIGDVERMGWYINNFAGRIMHHNIYHFHVVLATVILSWGLVWVLGFKGAFKNKYIGFVFLLQLAGAFIALLGAADHGRMMASISPAMFPAIALYFKGVGNEKVTTYSFDACLG